MMYLDMWRSDTFLLYSCKASFWIQETLPRLSDDECSVVLRSVFAIGSALPYLLFFWESLLIFNNLGRAKTAKITSQNTGISLKNGGDYWRLLEITRERKGSELGSRAYEYVKVIHYWSWISSWCHQNPQVFRRDTSYKTVLSNF